MTLLTSTSNAISTEAENGTGVALAAARVGFFRAVFGFRGKL